MRTWLSVGQLDLLQPRIECLIADGVVGEAVQRQCPASPR